MRSSTPHYLLFSQVGREGEPGWWRFTLESTECDERFEATDAEPNLSGERLQLLTLIRALESLDRPSNVTILSASSYVRQGICFGLPDWKANGWRWECFGQMVPIKDCDLWQRLDRALQFHQVDFRRWRIDSPHRGVLGPKGGVTHAGHHGIGLHGTLMLRLAWRFGETWRETLTWWRAVRRRWVGLRSGRRLAPSPAQG